MLFLPRQKTSSHSNPFWPSLLSGSQTCRCSIACILKYNECSRTMETEDFIQNSFLNTSLPDQDKQRHLATFAVRHILYSLIWDCCLCQLVPETGTTLSQNSLCGSLLLLAENRSGPGTPGRTCSGWVGIHRNTHPSVLLNTSLPACPPSCFCADNIPAYLAPSLFLAQVRLHVAGLLYGSQSYV